MKTLRADSLPARALARLTVILCRNRRCFLYTHVVLFVVSVLYTVRYLEFDTTRSNLVGSNKVYHQNYLQFKKEFPTQDDLVVVVESEDTEKNRQFVERLGAKLEAETNLFRIVFYKGDLKMLGSKALLFVPPEDLMALRQRLHDYRQFIEKFTRTTNMVSLFDMVNTQFRTAKREQSAETDSLIKALPALERIVTQASASLKRPGTPPSPGLTALFDAGEEAQQKEYITFDHGRIYLVTAQAPRKDQNGAAVNRLRELVEQTRLEVSGLNVGLTGEPVLERDEMLQSQKDTTVASIVSLVLCALIFIYGYQETGRPVKATICLVVGLAYTLAFATAVVGHLNVLTITFVPILIGLAIDFGVHLVTRYEEELRHGKSEEEALTKAMEFTGQGIFTGALTTAGAFLAMCLTDFKGIQEMGVICGGGLVICLLPMMTLLPVLLLRGRQNVLDQELGEPDARARLERLWLQRPVMVTLATASLCGLAAWHLPKVQFDYNLLNMQSHGLPSVAFERRLISATSSTNTTQRSILFGVVVADSLNQAAELEAKLKALSVVSGVDSISQFLNEDQTGKLPLIGEIKQELSPLQFQEPDPTPVKITALTVSLYALQGYLGAALEEVQKRNPELGQQFVSLRRAIENLRKEMLHGSAADVDAHSRKLGAFQRALFNDVRETFEVLRDQDNSERLRIEDLPTALRHRFVGVTGKYLLQVYPREKTDLWQRDDQRKFIEQLRTVDANATGTPVQLYEYTTLLKDSYVEAAWYALAAVALLVLIHFRNFVSVILALLPVAVGAVWLGGLMGYAGVPLNPANIMTLPLVVGIGVTNGIHILNRFAEEREPAILAKSTGKAVFVSGLTTIAGFGSLILAKHQGIQSLGYVMATGVATCMIAALTFLPALLNLLTRRGWLTKQPSADNARSTLGQEEPRKNL